MGGDYGSAHEEVVARDLVPVLHDVGQIGAFARLVRSGAATCPFDVHVKIDTGMSRLGVTMRDLPRLAAALGECPEVRVRGLMTHLACADAVDEAETTDQLARFEEATGWLKARGVSPEVRHAANSAAVIRGKARLDAVRPGIAIFGVAPRVGGEELTRELKAVMGVRTEVVALRDVDAGDAVGYGGTWRAARGARIATIPMGYADGLSRQLGNKGHALVRGKRVPIVGAVSMDMAMLDVTEAPGVSLRDEVVLLGAQEGPLGRGAIGADEIAGHAGTIPWEVLTSVSRRVPRFYREP
jgi:alanine racemase